MQTAVETTAKTLIYERRATTDEILVDLVGVRAIDRRLEKARAASKSWIAVGVGVCIVGALIFLLDLGPAVGVSAFFVGALAAIIATFRWSHFKGLDFEDRRYRLLARLLPLLQTDMAVGAEVIARLDLTRATTPIKATGKGAAGRWNVNYFDDPWLQLQGAFLDGTSFGCVVSERTQLRDRKSRSASGKTKHKKKVKAATRVQVTLRPKAQRYPGLEQLIPRVGSAVQLPEGAELRSLEYRGRAVVLKVVAPNQWSPELRASAQLSASNLVAMMFVSLYQVLNYARHQGGSRTA